MLRALNHKAEALWAQTTAVLARHPRRITATLAALLTLGTGLTYAVASFAPDASQVPVRAIVETLPTPDLQAQQDPLALQAMQLYRSDSTRSTDTADTLLKRLGVFDPQAAAFLRTNPLAQRNLLGRAGHRVTAQTDGNNALQVLESHWAIAEQGMYKRLRINRSGKGFVASIETLPLTASTRMASGTITSSLYAATDAARLPDSVSNQLAEIFSGDIDFHRALRKGDHFAVVYETLEADGEPVRYGRILSAEFVNNGKTHQALWFQEPVVSGSTTPAKGGYYTLAGESLKRIFLAAPLAFSRITSGFKMRFHPILQVWKAHLGVDYAAPVGTAVRSVGDGVVEFAGVQNGYGNVVKVKHQGAISTVYAHLSHINVRVGQAVPQGEVIGQVGMTGWATGPHLHFEYRVNGAYQDPQAIARRNDTVPLTAAMKPQFDRAAAQARIALAAAAQVRLRSVE